MFTQFFGNFLLNQNFITGQQLAKAFSIQKTTRVKLGVLAINAGYMTAKQVDEVHTAQGKTDKRFGDLACDMGFLNKEQVLSLLAQQTSSHLSLGQALIDLKYMTNEEFEYALNSYERKHSITDIDFTDIQNSKIHTIINDFYQFDSLEDTKSYTDYITLLFKNIIRFIGDDFIPLKPQPLKQIHIDCITSQSITGAFQAFTAITSDEKTFIQFANRFANEEFIEVNEYILASVAEFLNLHNGLFTVNMSDSRQMELEILPQCIDNDKVLSFSEEAYLIPITFSFGTIVIILSSNIPSIT
ncbi:chemotaxis protein CheX [Paludicola sp. MB14-C6]|uniref:chemotaxis protein CheX n=1 Tax=Paludihabitans sp. MB14-C6 TaxID=3070656 RepID=UPI0027DC3649|nr:chemotaxis protein CheX [Paludicola sp. MB14-C6]WMJ23860.1 chemotaxis protein CheX [Paludicola sp. MB14-C6]